ncbi:hypothetical protein JB92DRAFT_3068097 [Gautieria morchelliformis]|nr:hypothetical protein JB92DRAFT_3068097 [Gautieria morchelliformis]
MSGAHIAHLAAGSRDSLCVRVVSLLAPLLSELRQCWSRAAWFHSCCHRTCACQGILCLCLLISCQNLSSKVESTSKIPTSNSAAM